MGNILNGAGPIAGQVYISQFFTEANQGFISQVNNDGSMQIANGPVIRINDPNAIYSAGYTANPFFTADDENPSVSSFSGFPMCVPRNATDPLCPQSQRPVISGTSKQGILCVTIPLARPQLFLRRLLIPIQAGTKLQGHGALRRW